MAIQVANLGEFLLYCFMSLPRKENRRYKNSDMGQIIDK